MEETPPLIRRKAAPALRFFHRVGLSGWKKPLRGFLHQWLGAIETPAKPTRYLQVGGRVPY